MKYELEICLLSLFHAILGLILIILQLPLHTETWNTKICLCSFSGKSLDFLSLIIAVNDKEVVKEIKSQDFPKNPRISCIVSATCGKGLIVYKRVKGTLTQVRLE